jgi:crossover junction endodeoxyribonuclease RusA
MASKNFPPEYQHFRVEFSVPLLAPSVNHYVKHTRSGSHYVSREAKAFKDAVRLFSRGMFCRFPWYYVDITLGLGPNQRGDIDNFGKLCLDALVDAGVIDSDAKVTDLVLHKRRGKEENTHFGVYQGEAP